MKRPKSHETGALAESIAEECFLFKGWVVYKCRPDYGFDFIVHPTERGNIVMNLALIQVKGVEDHLARSSGGTLPFAIDTKHLRLWADTATPSYLCVVELPSRKVFLGRTWYFTDKLWRSYGDDWTIRQGSYTIHLEAGMLVEGDRFSRLEVALRKAWDSMRGPLISGWESCPDFALPPPPRPPRHRIRSELKKGAGFFSGSRLYKRTRLASWLSWSERIRGLTSGSS